MCKYVYRTVKESIALVIDEDEPGSVGVGENLAYGHLVAILVDTLPVLDVETLNQTSLERKKVITLSTVSGRMCVCVCAHV